MLKTLPKISEQIYPGNILDILENKYSTIGPVWTNHQMEWSNAVYRTFKDHNKYLIIIYLIKKTLDFYSRNFVKLTYNEFYSKDIVEIEKFSIIEVSKNINIPKESARRKIIELEKNGIIKRSKKKIVIDRSAYRIVKPNSSIKRVSRFLSLFSKALVDEKILLNPLSSEHLQKVIEKNFSYIWKLYYEMQIPMLLNYKKVFNDLETFHIYGTCVVNQHFHSKKINENKMNRVEFIKSIYSNDEMIGVNAMSISDITGIPRATVVRKLKKLLKLNHLKIDKKKHYRMTGLFMKKLVPLQKIVLNQLAKFSTKVYNLAIL
jgi:predicted transcriptional regulator